MESQNAEKVVAEVKIPWGLNFNFCMKSGKIEPENIVGSPISFIKFAADIIEKSGESILAEKNPHVLSAFLKIYRQSLIEDLDEMKNSITNLQKILLSDELMS